MKLIMENWKRFLKEEILEEEAVENIDDQGLMVYPSIDDPQYIILYNPLIAKPLLRGMDFDKIERIHNGVLELRFNSKHNALENCGTTCSTIRCNWYYANSNQRAG